MSGLTCAEFVELVTAYLEGSLDRETEGRFVAHATSCEGCERYLDQFRQTIALMGSLSPESISPRARRDLLSAFRDWPGPSSSTSGADDPDDVGPLSSV